MTTRIVDDPWDTTQIRGSGDDYVTQMRSHACAAIEKMPFADDKVREVATRFVERDGEEHAPVANLVLATTSPDYSRAFTKMIRSRGNPTVLSGREVQAYQRAMSLTDNQGGFLVPMQLDPTIILTANGSFNQVRQISRVVQATGKSWTGVTSAGVSGSWDGEAVEVSDDSPELQQPEIPVHKLQIWVEFSHELQHDAAGLADDIAKMIAFEKDVKESIAFATGSGVGQPRGVITALMGSDSVVNSAVTDTFAAGDVHNLDGDLPQRYAFNASWLAHRKIYSKIRQFDTNGGASLWGQLAEGRKSELLGRPDYVAEAMDSSITNGQDNHVLAFGDFQNFVIADRLGTTLSYIPNLMGPNGRPVGKAGWHAWIRVGSDVVNPGAFRLLNVT
ncbi:phage major capsid protein [Mycolicibacterium vanbaalenii]|uniref:Phage major capsid protein, HK97 n=1 Tax=Mycolicibacterium vanbaalenii (strain DSM 7251 / JCM 13017 / BCRC 16820 / KCTC 9966 / NRRL B-24157 / PYR-1) TaxID=350058 RepID=A1TD88_MYCVP|nr:phage major capsid protein [Mycolicibacterium vanbaalenii]ABM15138.1 phage major capsid protein, HK97 [Mycolicibacterium vanbaalenii PYR-1]